MRLAITGVRKAFDGVHALCGVSFDLRAGEVHALVGENGAGKSTLIKILTGAHRPDTGTITVEGQSATHLTPALARELGIAAIYQQPALFPHLSVAENLAIALEAASPWQRVHWRARRARAKALLHDLDAPIDPDQPVGGLSMPEQQLVEIAKAVGADARVLLMDEPTASLTHRETTRLFEVIRRLCARGVAIVYISHRLAEVFALADRVTVLRDGEVVATRDRSTLSTDELIRLMVGRALEHTGPTAAPLASAAVALQLDGISSREAGLRSVSLQVRRGEIVGIAGLVGAGRTELAETIFGLRRLDGGTLRVKGDVVRPASPRDAIASGIAYLPEDRLRHGVIGDMSVAANTTLASLGRVSKAGLIDRGLESRTSDEYVARFRIKTPDRSTPVAALSGGNQQKVALARWLATAPAVLIVDEPTQGVDVGSKAEIHARLRQLAGDGLAILMISSELPEILAVSDRILVMRRGEIVGELQRAEATEEGILALALPDASASPAGPSLAASRPS
ncbi:MAG: sugar ABC transporter ATP-binding protein [Vicinamibacterales bacterium]